MKNILITGTSGFIGPHVIEASIKMNLNVFAIDKIAPNIEDKFKECNYIEKDIRDLKVEDISNIDAIIHLAFITNIPFSVANPVSTTNDNITMTAQLLDLATKAGVKKFIFSSTASLYGNNPIPWKESMLPDSIEPYSWQKLSCEYLCKMWSSRYSLKTGILRLFQVYGENQRKDTALYKFIDCKKKNIPITLTETTAQSAFKTGRRDFIYVKDVANAFIKAVLSDKICKGEILNVGTGEMTSMEQIANTIGGRVEFIPKRSFEVEAHQADLTNTNNLIDWRPSVNIIDWLNVFCNNKR